MRRVEWLFFLAMDAKLQRLLNTRPMELGTLEQNKIDVLAHLAEDMRSALVDALQERDALALDRAYLADERNILRATLDERDAELDKAQREHIGVLARLAEDMRSALVDALRERDALLLDRAYLADERNTLRAMLSERDTELDKAQRERDATRAEFLRLQEINHRAVVR